MKNIPFASRRSIHQTTFSPDLSSKRLDRIQSLLKNSSLDGILAVLGIDSKYNEGCRQLANYLLFGFYKLNAEQLDEVEITDEDLDDLVILVRKTSISIYCCSNLYHYLLPYVAHWNNLVVHCLPVQNDQNEIDEDEREEFKIRSLVEMVAGLKSIGIPYVSPRMSNNSFSPLMLEKWPLIQSYALEGVGRGTFFTMQFNVVSVHEELLPIYEECDPANLELILTESLPLLERHWTETMACIAGGKSGLAMDISEQTAAEPLLSYFNHGRLAASTNGATPHTSPPIVKPDVCFGVRTRDLDNHVVSSSATLQNSGGKGSVLHMVIQGSSPRKPLSCCRTYFLTPHNQKEQRDLELLMNLYRECISACRAAVAEYTLSFDVSNSCSVANKVLSTACSQYCDTAKHDCKMEILDASNKVVRLRGGQPSFHVKRVFVSITDVCNVDGEVLGSVRFGDSFINSALQVQAVGTREKVFDTEKMILTKGIPAFVEWNAWAESFECGSKLLSKLTGSYLCSDSILLDVQQTCELEVYHDGSITVRSHHLSPFHIPASSISKMASYNPSSPYEVALLHPLLRPGAPLPSCFNQSQLAFAFFPQSSAWKVFTNVIDPHLAQMGLYSSIDEVSPLLSSSYSILQSSYDWISGRSYRVMSRSSALIKCARSLLPQLAGFVPHFSSSFIFSMKAIPQHHVDGVVGREVEAAGERSREGKVCITIVCGLPGSHADRLCASLVALHKEKVRWVVVKVQAMDGDARLVDGRHLQTQLAELVAKKRAARPGVAATKRLRIIVEAVGFFDVSSIVSCIVNHESTSLRDQMFIGAVSTCVHPLVVYMENSRLFPNVLEQCKAGMVSSVVFTGIFEDLKDRYLAAIQAMVRNVNNEAAFIIAPSANVRRSPDFDLILNQTGFDSDEFKARRFLSVPGIWNGTFTSRPPPLTIRELKLHFSQPLLKGTLCARLRAFKHNLAPFPFNGNVYMVMGIVRFTEPSDKCEESSLCFVTRTGDLEIEPRPIIGMTPAPPSGRTGVASKSYHLRFYGVGLNEENLRDWIRRCGRQSPTKKAHRSRESLSKAERKKIQVCHQQVSLPEGVFFNGSQYCSLADNTRSYEHPCLETFIDEYLETENQKIDEYNKKIEAQSVPDMFDGISL